MLADTFLPPPPQPLSLDGLIGAVVWGKRWLEMLGRLWEPRAGRLGPGTRRKPGCIRSVLDGDPQGAGLLLVLRMLMVGPV